MATKNEIVVRAVLDVRDVPFTVYTLPGEQTKTREWKHNSKERRTLTNQLASYANPDGTHIEVSIERMAKDIGWSVRAVKDYLDDLTAVLGFLVDDGWAFHFGKRVRRRTLLVGRILEAAKVQNSNLESAKLDSSKVQNSEVESAKLGGQSAKLPIESANLIPATSVDSPNLSALPSEQPKSGEGGKILKPKTTPKAQWADVMAHLPKPMREGSWFAQKDFEPRPEAGLRELIADYGPLAVCGAVRQWWSGESKWWWKDFVLSAPAYLANGGAAKFEKAERERRIVESPEGIAAIAAAQEKLNEQTFTEMALACGVDKAEAEYENLDPLAGMQ